MKKRRIGGRDGCLFETIFLSATFPRKGRRGQRRGKNLERSMSCERGERNEGRKEEKMVPPRITAAVARRKGGG